MLTFLFWNLNARPLEAVVASLARTNNVDVIVLAECEAASSELLRYLNRRAERDFEFTFSSCEKVAVYTRFSSEFVLPISETNRFTVRRLRLPASPEILMAAAHLPGKLFWSDRSQAFECERYARMIREAEDVIGHRRTVVLGDFNMHPFEEGLLAAPSFNAMMTREIASRGARTVQGESYPCLFNPMWRFFGDGTAGPPGTYYREAAEHVTTFWSMFDQVLVRPALLRRFRSESVRILSSAGRVRLLDRRGVPDSGRFSDHLPIIFQLDI
ncbi:MAG: endonuclease/exonuclease/phosphatase family protein [Planctomycetes bacterium]|nr:endonuclease/exonuclease/phosphatase family protein [Planctomycetota bacterium]